MGDAFLVMFPSALDAARCAYDIQRATREFNTPLPEERRIHLRVGVHLGDVVESEGDISGDAVNVASRIEPLAEDGGVCLTRQVYDHVQNKFELPLKSLGTRLLKNVRVPLEVYKMVMPWGDKKDSSIGGLNKKRIAVVPFTNISPDPADEYFADGLTDELIDRLSRVKDLEIIARTSVMSYKNKEKTAAEIGSELRAGTLIEGSVRKIGNKVRVTADLIDATTESHLWSSRYDKELGDVFAVQGDIAENVANALEVKLLPANRRRIAKAPTRSTEAHLLYLKGRHHWYFRSEEGVTKAIKYFEEAISRDPEYAPAYVGLADCYSILGTFGYRRPSLMYPKAKEFALKALELDESLAEAHASMGEILMHYNNDWQGAERELRRSLELNPNYAQAHAWLSTWYAVRGSMEAAIAEAGRAQELDPFSVVVMNELAKNFYYARRYDDAIAQFRRSLEIEPDSAYLHKGLAETYVQKSMFKEGIAEIEKALSLAGTSSFILSSAGYVYAVSGRRAKAREVLRELDEISSDQFVPSYGQATILIGLREKEAALGLLEKAREERAWAIWMKVEPIFDVLRGERKFQDLLRKMRLRHGADLNTRLVKSAPVHKPPVSS